MFGFVHTFLDRVQGVKVMYSLDSKQFQSIGELKEPVTTKDLNGRNCKFFTLKISEASKIKPFIFNGMILEAELEQMTT